MRITDLSPLQLEVLRDATENEFLRLRDHKDQQLNEAAKLGPSILKARKIELKRLIDKVNQLEEFKTTFQDMMRLGKTGVSL